MSLDAAFYTTLHDDFERLLRGLEPGWTRAELEPIRQDVANGQPDLATEQLAAACVVLQKSLTPELVASISELAERQGLAGSTYLQRLYARAAELGIQTPS